MAEVKEGSEIIPVAVNMANSIIGAGIIGLPFALSLTGFGLGIFLLLLMALVSRLSLGWLIDAGIALRSRSYEDVAYQTLGKMGYNAVLLSMFGEFAVLRIG